MKKHPQDPSRRQGSRTLAQKTLEIQNKSQNTPLYSTKITVIQKYCIYAMHIHLLYIYICVYVESFALVHRN